jgi:pimeloyl-ACP methyl ester carboxylesterase
LTKSILSNLYGPEGYHELDESISALLNDDECNFELNILGFASTFDNPQSFLPYWAILCSDTTFRPKSPDDYFSSYRVNEVHSPFLNQFLLAQLPCVHWKARAAEQINLDRPETVHTKTPILLVNGAYDPMTPLGNARKISARFPGSQVVVHEGVGVSIIPCLELTVILTEIYSMD